MTLISWFNAFTGVCVPIGQLQCYYLQQHMYVFSKQSRQHCWCLQCWYYLSYCCLSNFSLSYESHRTVLATIIPVCFQQAIQTALVVLALLMVPVMLLIKPFILRARHNAKMRVSALLYSWTVSCMLYMAHIDGPHTIFIHCPPAIVCWIKIDWRNTSCSLCTVCMFFIIFCQSLRNCKLGYITHIFVASAKQSIT